MNPRLVPLHPVTVGGHSPVADLEAWYGVARPTPADRPWVAVNMIASLDGAITVGGRSGGLGNATDRAVLGALRRSAAMILVGAGTVAAEGYGAPKRAGQRVAVATNSGRLDPAAALFASGAGFALTHAAAAVPAGIEVVRAGGDELDLAVGLARLGERLPAGGWIVAEGGPTLNAALFTVDVVDEVNLTTAPMVVGGDGGRMTAGAGDLTRRFELVHQLLDDEQYVFSRWVRAGRSCRRHRAC